LSPGKYKVTVTFPERTWSFVGEGIAPPYIRDKKGNLYSTGGTQAIKWDSCGNEIARLTIPAARFSKHFVEYGDAIVAPDGDVFTWKRTPNKYAIIKWHWVNDPKEMTQPCVEK
jgi:hypothetical protein